MACAYAFAAVVVLGLLCIVASEAHVPGGGWPSALRLLE
jgi:hypothetical protein